jgi:branched-chain amino acid transport system permease protein
VSELVFFSLLNGLVFGLLLFMLSSGLTLIFGMMGVLNFAHASLYMLGAYLGYTTSRVVGFWAGLVVAPVIVGGLGAVVERYGLRRVHRFGHVAELIFTFGLAVLVEEIVQLVWGRPAKSYDVPALLDFPLFTLSRTSFPAFKGFMLLISVGIFVFLFLVLTRTRAGLIIQASLTHPNMVNMLGHNVPLVFMVVFGIGSALAGLAGVIAGPVLGTFPGMAQVLGSIVFVVIVIGGLGSITGAFVASLLIGVLQTFAVALNTSVGDVARTLGVAVDAGGLFADLWGMTVAQVAPILPYLLLVLILIFRPMGFFGTRET